MTCTECQERLLEGAPYDSAMAAHLDGCEHCGAFQAALAEADAQLGALAGATAPAGFDSAVLRRLRAEPGPSWLPEILDFLGWAGSAALAGALVWNFAPADWISTTSALAVAGACLAGSAIYGLRVSTERG